MSQKFSIVSSANTGDRLKPMVKAACQLSDGTLVHLYSDGAASPTVSLGYSSDHSTHNLISNITVNSAGGFYCPQTGVAALSLCRDSSNNLYVVGFDNSQDLIRVQAYVKGAGYTWTQKTSLTATNGNSNFLGVETSGVWCNTGGGTNSKGHLLTIGQHSNGNLIYVIADAGAALNGSGTLQTAYGSNPAFLTNNGTYTGGAAGLELSPDGYGATSGLSVNVNQGNTNKLGVGSWAVNSSGALSTNSQAGIGLNDASIAWSGTKSRLVRYASAAWALFQPDSGGNKITVSRWTTSGQATASATYGTVTNWPNIAAAMAWDVVLDPGVANQVWLYAWSTGTATTMLRIPVALGSGISWTTTTTTDDTSVGSGGTNTTIRTVREAGSGATLDWQTFNANAGTDALLGDYTTFASAPNADTLTSPANGAYLDATVGFTPTSTYNSTDGANANARALRYKASGGGSYSYWNAGSSSWQGTIVWNTVSIAPGGSGSFGPITAGLSNGSVYNWSMASQEAYSNLQGPFASDFAFTAQAAPGLTVTAPTGTVNSTSSPTVTWTTTPGGGASQTTYRVVVEHGAYGTTPGSGTQDWDSTTISGSAQSLQIGAALANGTTFRAFVQVAETGGQLSAWAYTTFTVSLDTPAVPTITAATGTDGTTGCPRVAITVQGRDNLLTANQASLETDTTGWAAGANTTIARSTAQALDGSASLSLTSGAAGNVSATTPTGSSGFAVTPSQQVTFLASFRSAANARSANVQVLWYQANGSASGVRASDTSSNITTSTSAWTQASMTVTAPSDAAFAAVVVTVLATGGASEVHYVDQIGFAPGASTTWTRGGLAGSTTVLLTRSDGIVVRPASGTAIPSPGQSVTVYDYEPTPSTSYTYTAVVSAVVGGSTISSAASAASNAVTVTTTGWWLVDPTSTAGAVSPPVIAFTSPRFEQVSHKPALGSTTALVTADVVMNADGQMTFETFDSATWTSLQAILVSQRVLFVSSPFGESFYGRFGLSPGVSGSTGGLPRAPALQPSAGTAPHRTSAATFVAQPRPAP